MTCACLPFTGCTGCGTTDTFTRTESGGLGTPDCGLTYTFNDATRWADDGTKAILTVNTATASSASLLFRGQTSTTAVVTAQVTSTVIGDAPTDMVYIGMEAGAYAHSAFVTFATDGSVSLTTETGTATTTLGFTARTLCKIRVATDGTNAVCNIWLASDPEPAGWTLTQAFSSAVPLFDIDLFYGAQTADPTLIATFDGLDALGITRCTLNQFDTFEREVVADSWGSATPGGQAWTISAGFASSAYVTGGYGVLENAPGFPFFSNKTMHVNPGITPNGDFTVTIQLLVSSDVDVYSALFIFNDFEFGWTHAAGSPPTVEVADGGGLVSVLFDPLFWFNLGGVGMMKAQRIGPTARLKLWDSASPEPLNWTLIGASGTQVTPASSPGAVIFAAGESGAVGTQTVQIGNIEFEYPGKPCYIGGPAAAPTTNQPVLEEVAGYGDGSTTIFYTDYPYLPNSLMVEVAGLLGEHDNTNPATGSFTLIDIPASGAEIRATYRAA